MLVGPAGAGKSTFAATNFAPTEVVSTDAARAMIGDDEGDQSVNSQAFALARFIAIRRLKLGRLTVIDATNVRAPHRAPFVALAARFRRPAVALVFDYPLEVCIARNLLRPRTVESAAIAEQWSHMPRPPESLKREGFTAVHVFDPDHEPSFAEVVRAVG